MDEAHGGSLVDPGVFLQVIPAPEALGADGAGEGTQSGVDAFVARQFLVACESLPAGFFLAFKRPFTGVAADVSFQLAVVAERHLAVRAAEAFGSLLLGRMR